MNNSHRQMKDEKAKHIATMEAFKVAKKKIQELNVKLTKADREKKSIEAALQGVEKQVEAQHKQLQQTEDELATTKDHIKVLKKKLEEAEKAKDQDKQDKYNVRVAETKEALKAKVSECVGATTSRCGTRPLTKLGLRPLLPLGKQRVYTILLPSVHQALLDPRLTLSSKR